MRRSTPRLTFSQHLWEEKKASEEARSALNMFCDPCEIKPSSQLTLITLSKFSLRLPAIPRRLAGHLSMLALALTVASGGHLARLGISQATPQTLAASSDQLSWSEQRPVSLITHESRSELARGGIISDALYTPPGGPQTRGAQNQLLPIDGLGRAGQISGVVKEDETNLRTGPAVFYDRVGMLAKGAEVVLLARYGDWFQIRRPEGAGSAWMAAELLNVPAHLSAQLPEAQELPPVPTWIWPASGAFTSGFGWRSYPRGFHDGVDVANDYWTPIWAARSGVVTEAGWCSGFGYCVKMIHDDGFETIYGHMVDTPEVMTGDTVQAGSIIGYMGSTYDLAGGGYSTGSHLHFIIKLDGVAVDPLDYLPSR